MPSFVVCYDSQRKAPLWTAYRLTPEMLTAEAPRHHAFVADLTLRSASNADYRGSGFSRGHLTPARDMAHDENAHTASFLLSNAAPQRQRLNAGKWRQLENAVRRVAATADNAVVITGALYTSQTIGDRVSVPSHFFKAVLAEAAAGKSLYAAVLPNQDELPGTLEDYLVSVDKLEQLTGVDLFASLPDDEEARLEAAVTPLPKPGSRAR